MSTSNFNWCLHALLFLHTERVIAMQNNRAARQQTNKNTGSDEEEEEDGFNIDREDAYDIE
jgi:hypothetical protein